MNPLIFWVEREVAFPITRYRRISFQTVPKKRLLYFDAMVFKELKVQSQEDKLDVKIF